MKATTKTRMAMSIASSRSDVFLRSSFDRFGSASRVTRALQDLIKEGRIVRLGYGVYAKAFPSPISGKPIPRIPLENLIDQTLVALSVKFELGKAREDYTSEKSTHIPIAVVVKPIGSRISRKISLGNREVIYE